MGISKNTLKMSKLVDEHFNGNVPGVVKEKLRELRKHAVLYEDAMNELMSKIESPK